MINPIKLMIVSSMLAIATTAAAEKAPLGIWKTIDDVTGKPKAIVRITETANQLLEGRILKLYPQPGEVPKERCTACQGKRHNQPMIGLTVMEYLVPNKGKPGEWNNGEILDPKTGKVYSCSIRVIDHGQKLNVRGFLGLPLFGRTQTWIKVEDVTKA